VRCCWLLLARYDIVKLPFCYICDLLFLPVARYCYITQLTLRCVVTVVGVVVVGCCVGVVDYGYVGG